MNGFQVLKWVKYYALDITFLPNFERRKTSFTYQFLFPFRCPSAHLILRRFRSRPIVFDLVKIFHKLFFYLLDLNYGILETKFLFSENYLHSKIFCLMLHQKETLICWLKKFVLSCIIIYGELHPKMVKNSDKSTKIWCSLGRIFIASKSMLLFGVTSGKFFVQCKPFWRTNVRIYLVWLFTFLYKKI